MRAWPIISARTRRCTKELLELADKHLHAVGKEHIPCYLRFPVELAGDPFRLAQLHDSPRVVLAKQPLE